ncbi:MAG: hypothetical protein LUE63_06080 [Lachnospiraceae bacterium]|nr:hypothetical protein [Lachnospiraceae bacterium]
MKKRGILALAIIMAGLLTGLSGQTVYAAETEETTGVSETASENLLQGIVKDESGFSYYYIDGTMQTGWQTIDGNTYYFRKKASETEPKGAMMTGLRKIGGSKYYFKASGKMLTGWKTIDGSRYYFKSNGKMVTGWKTIDENRYYFKASGKMVTGWKTIDNNRFYFSSKGKMATGWKTINGKTYYFKKKTGKTLPKGAMLTGLRKINGYKYYFSAKGVMQTNRIVGSKTEGYYYVDDNGKVITSKEIKLAVKFVVAHTDNDWSASKKLKTCFNYLWKNYSYKRSYDSANASTLSGFAVNMFTTKKGNCFRYAASFACIAKVLGYESRVAVGKISSLHGGMTAHGWTEVKVNGKWYICDANMQKNYPSINSYMRTESTYAYRHSCSARYVLKTSKGKAVWKKK